jgi:hypothetical protein
MKVRALMNFNALEFGITAVMDEVFEIEDRLVRLDLERLGWIQPFQTVENQIS